MKPLIFTFYLNGTFKYFYQTYKFPKVPEESIILRGLASNIFLKAKAGVMHFNLKILRLFS
jgi:hypothetical protein